MTNDIASPATQLGFDSLLANADSDNHARKFARETAHLPADMADAIPYFRSLIDSHNAAMLAADVEETTRLREKAHLLAVKLNEGKPGILADENSPGNVLTRETAAPSGAVPLWGQAGDFIITVAGTRIRIEQDGIFGICCGITYWPGLSAHVVDRDKPFISETGYRSFLGFHLDLEAGLTPDKIAERLIAAYIRDELKGRLCTLDDRYSR